MFIVNVCEISAKIFLLLTSLPIANFWRTYFTDFKMPKPNTYKYSKFCIDGGKYIWAFYQEGRGHWAVYYTGPQSYIVTFC